MEVAARSSFRTWLGGAVLCNSFRNRLWDGPGEQGDDGGPVRCQGPVFLMAGGPATDVEKDSQAPESATHSGAWCWLGRRQTVSSAVMQLPPA